MQDQIVIYSSQTNLRYA